jgi:hypothetical protein
VVAVGGELKAAQAIATARRSSLQRMSVRDRAPLIALAAAGLLGSLAATLATATTGTSAKGLAVSTASAHVVQPQPAPRSCHARGSGLTTLPDARCTPGAVNPAVRPTTLRATICKAGWTATVRPSASITGKEKRASMEAYDDGQRTSSFEYDHLVPLELGGAVNDARNLWPEPDYPVRSGFYLNPKDRLERTLNRRVCAGTMSLAQAQRAIALDWVSANARFG